MTPAELERALASHPRVDMPALPGRTNHIPTGVLLPIVWEPRPEVLVTVRSAHLRYHAGEVCFPGGRLEPGDVDVRATAVREAREELGLEGARVLGELSSIPLYTSDYRLHPFVAEIARQPLTLSVGEVAEALWISLEDTLALDTIEAIPWTHEGTTTLSPVFRVGDRLMFGGTAHAFYELLLVAAPLYGRVAPPLEARGLTWEDVIPALRDQGQSGR
jgi:8-oxo-dGTP pyrophosphatase MutT (NUDIX family)